MYEDIYIEWFARKFHKQFKKFRVNFCCALYINLMELLNGGKADENISLSLLFSHLVERLSTLFAYVSNMHGLPLLNVYLLYFMYVCVHSTW